MTTATNSSANFAHNTVAGFKLWVTEYMTLLTSTGFALSTDTGQLDIDAVVAVPSVAAYAGYKMVYLNDSLHSSRPVYLKLEFGTGSSGSIPRIRLTVGFGTDGAGNFTTSTLGPLVLGPGTAPVTGTLNSYAAGGEGYGWIAFKTLLNAGNTYTFAPIAVTRSCSITGTPTDEAIGINTVTEGQLTNNSQYYNILFAGRVTPLISAATYQAVLTGGITDPQLSGADIQYWRTYMNTPRMRTNPFIVLSHSQYNGLGAIKNLAPISGAPARNYISMDFVFGQGNGAWAGTIAGSQPANPRNCPMLIWE